MSSRQGGLPSHRAPRPDRRVHPRVPGGGAAAVLRGGELLGSYPVRNLSTGGALLVGRVPLEIGQRVRVLLELGPEECARVDADVVRQEQDDTGQPLFALQFRRLSPDMQDRIQQHVLAGLSATRSESVLLLGRTELLGKLKSTLLEHGAVVHVASSPLQAIALIDAHSDIRAAAVPFGPWGLTLLSFLAEERPAIRRVALSEGDFEPVQLEGCVLSGFADAVLVYPWTTAEAAHACGLEQRAG